MMPDIVITGVSGLVGYHLAGRLLKKGVPVLGIDRLSTVFTHELEASPQFTFRKANVESMREVQQAIPATAEVVYHLAGQPSVYYANAHPREDFTTNVMGTINILERVRENGKGRIIYASTGDVYGGTATSTEEKVPNPTNFYGLSKLTAESYIRQYSLHSPLKYCILRCAMIYGPLQQRNIILDILKGLYAGEIALFTALNSDYDMLYIEDAVDALEMAASQPWEGRTINISTGQGILVENMIKKVSAIVKRGADTKVDIREPNTIRKVYANALALQMGWKPETTFDDGLAKMIGWWLKENENSSCR
jgi:UDP-glucose 4-epimerase